MTGILRNSPAQRAGSTCCRRAPDPTWSRPSQCGPLRNSVVSHCKEEFPAKTGLFVVLVIAGLGLPLPVLASPACQPCHAARVQAQSATPHARALSRYGGEHFAGRKVSGRGGAQFSYSRRELTLSRGSQNITTPVEWAFGSGVQAVTLLVSRGGQWVEHRLSWYRAGDRLGLTPGHDPAPPFDLEEEIGIVQTARNAERCFQCHRPNSEPGVHCQACHGEGAGHTAAPSG